MQEDNAEDDDVEEDEDEDDDVEEGEDVRTPQCGHTVWGTSVGGGVPTTSPPPCSLSLSLPLHPKGSAKD